MQVQYLLFAECLPTISMHMFDSRLFYAVRTLPVSTEVDQ